MYCKDDDRTGEHSNTSFDFLGYTFRPRGAKNRWGKFFVSFLPAMSGKAAQEVRDEIASWRIPKDWSNKSLGEIAQFANPRLRGWMEYYGRFYRSECKKHLHYFNEKIAAWAERKYKGVLSGMKFVGRIARQARTLFPIWANGIHPRDWRMGAV